MCISKQMNQAEYDSDALVLPNSFIPCVNSSPVSDEEQRGKRSIAFKGLTSLSSSSLRHKQGKHIEQSAKKRVCLYSWLAESGCFSWKHNYY